jgi:ABC-type transport system involved in cytochrome c biogenesis permease subunit
MITLSIVAGIVYLVSWYLLAKKMVGNDMTTNDALNDMSHGTPLEQVACYTFAIMTFAILLLGFGLSIVAIIKYLP